jgi:hypothetical protein
MRCISAVAEAGQNESVRVVVQAGCPATGSVYVPNRI